MGVATIGGISSNTRTGLFSSCQRRVWLKLCSAALLAQYTAQVSLGTIAKPEDTLTTAASRCAVKIGRKASVSWAGAVRLMLISWAICSAVCVAKGWVNCTPALFTKMLTSGKSRTRRSRSVSCDTSATAMRQPESWSAAWRKASSRLPTSITRLPALWNFFASAKPMPVAPPVIRTVWWVGVMIDR